MSERFGDKLRNYVETLPSDIRFVLAVSSIISAMNSKLPAQRNVVDDEGDLEIKTLLFVEMPTATGQRDTDVIQHSSNLKIQLGTCNAVTTLCQDNQGFEDTECRVLTKSFFI